VPADVGSALRASARRHVKHLGDMRRRQCPAPRRRRQRPGAHATSAKPRAHRPGDMPSAQAIARSAQATCPAPRRSRAAPRRHTQRPGDMPSAQATWAAPCAHRLGDMPRRLGDIGTAQRLGPCQATSPHARAQPTSADAIAYATSAWDICRCQMLVIYSGLPCDHWHHGTRAPSDAHHNTTPHGGMRHRHGAWADVKC
jgi:hypothetical protein